MDLSENIDAVSAAEHHHHHHHGRGAEIFHETQVAAYYLWEAAGKPLFDAAITFENWIDAEENLENKQPEPEPPPTE